MGQGIAKLPAVGGGYSTNGLRKGRSELAAKGVK